VDGNGRLGVEATRKEGRLCSSSRKRTARSMPAATCDRWLRQDHHRGRRTVIRSSDHPLPSKQRHGATAVANRVSRSPARAAGITKGAAGRRHTNNAGPTGSHCARLTQPSWGNQDRSGPHSALPIVIVRHRPPAATCIPSQQQAPKLADRRPPSSGRSRRHENLCARRPRVSPRQAERQTRAVVLTIASCG